ncbi:MAG: hypothetical protein KDG89_15010 [Geminicoccaceae bacterium]|nr:hypothetical protein [Geminicoccaceae bacterium]
MPASRKAVVWGLLGIAALAPPALAGGSRGQFVIRVQVVDACTGACLRGSAPPASAPAAAEAAAWTETVVDPATGAARVYYVF